MRGHSPIKPFDEDTVVAHIDTDRIACSLKNHTAIGGLFESVASALAKRGIGRELRSIGLPDEFLEAGALPTLFDSLRPVLPGRGLAELASR